MQIPKQIFINSWFHCRIVTRGTKPLNIKGCSIIYTFFDFGILMRGERFGIQNPGNCVLGSCF